MTVKELSQLTKTDLLELLIIERQEINRLVEEQNKLTGNLDILNVRLENIGDELAETQKPSNNSVLPAEHSSEQQLS